MNRKKLCIMAASILALTGTTVSAQTQGQSHGQTQGQTQGQSQGWSQGQSQQDSPRNFLRTAQRLSQMDGSLTDAIQAAERHTNGTAVAVRFTTSRDFKNSQMGNRWGSDRDSSGQFRNQQDNWQGDPQSGAADRTRTGQGGNTQTNRVETPPTVQERTQDAEREMRDGTAQRSHEREMELERQRDQASQQPESRQQTGQQGQTGQTGQADQQRRDGQQRQDGQWQTDQQRRDGQQGQTGQQRQAGQDGQWQTDQQRRDGQGGQWQSSDEDQSLYAIVTCVVDRTRVRDVVIDMSDKSIVGMQSSGGSRNYTSSDDRNRGFGSDMNFGDNQNQGRDWNRGIDGDQNRDMNRSTDRSRDLDRDMNRLDQRSDMVRASDIMNASVRNAQGDRIGDIDELAIDPDSNRVVYGVLRRGGFLGMGETRHAVPISELSNHRDGRVVLNIQDSAFDSQSGFDTNNWPTQANERLSSRSTQQMGAQSGVAGQRDQAGQHDAGAGQRYTADQREASEPRHTEDQRDQSGQRATTGQRDQVGQRDGARATRVVKASDIIGSDVVCRDGRDIGDIEDLVVDTRNGRVVYAIVNSSRGEMPIPMSALQASGERFTVQMTQAQTQTMPTINSDRDPNWNDAQWNRQLHDNYGTRMEVSAVSTDRDDR